MPLKKDNVTNIIAPFWYARFPGGDNAGARADTPSLTDAMSDDELSPERKKSGKEERLFKSQSLDIMKTVEAIDALLVTCNSQSALEEKWSAVWEKLHLLKGNLLTVYGSGRAKVVVEAINKLRGEDVPEELRERWTLIRSLVVSLI